MKKCRIIFVFLIFTILLFNGCKNERNKAAADFGKVNAPKFTYSEKELKNQCYSVIALVKESVNKQEQENIAKLCVAKVLEKHENLYGVRVDITTDANLVGIPYTLSCYEYGPEGSIEFKKQNEQKNKKIMLIKNIERNNWSKRPSDLEYIMSAMYKDYNKMVTDGTAEWMARMVCRANIEGMYGHIRTYVNDIDSMTHDDLEEASKKSVREMKTANYKVEQWLANVPANEVNVNEPPEMFVMKNVMPGEVWYDPLERYVMGKIDITLYSEADITSKKMEKLRHNKLAKINAVETHVFPHKNKIDRDGEDVYLLVYRGEGRYSAWVDGKIVDYLEMNTNRINTDAELWIRINNPDSNTDGWINTEEYKNKDFFRAAGTGIFLKPSFKNSRSNNWS